jgi:predicted acylesterase/phospholipase RssA
MTSSVPRRNRETADNIAKPRFAGLSRMLGSGRHKLYISLGSGSVLSFASGCALFTLLEESGLAGSVQEVWGNSSGAMVGGLWSAGRSAEELVEMVSRLRVGQVRDIAWGHILRGFLRSPFNLNGIDGFLKGNKLERLLEKNLPVKTFEECRVPFRCIAYPDDGTDRIKVFDRGPLAPAIRASISMQWVFLPKVIDGVRYLDGTMAEKTPMQSIMDYHRKSGDKRKPVILATYNGWDEGYHRLGKSHYGLLKRANQFKEVLQGRAFWAQVELAEGQGAQVVVLSPGSYDVRTLDVGRFGELYRRALVVMGERLGG